MRNKGLHQNRFSKNPLEKIFAEEWEKANGAHIAGTPLLDYALAPNNQYPRESTEREREVAATVIQWLGSDVGQAFLRDVKEKCDKI